MTGAIASLTLPGRITRHAESALRAEVSPLALPGLRAVSQARLYFGTATMDRSGRVYDRAAVVLLGWAPGDRLLLTVLDTSVVYQRRGDGVFAMTSKPYVIVPAPVRARCAIHTGDRVLLAADPSQDALVVHPPAAVTAMLSHFHTRLAGGADA
jgi:bifunctional DNA-binding transcriptional regulator/antitoxin component of YhaV-PrlF toxin-antitoxin module